MKHDLSRDERRARARVVSAGVGLALAAAGVSLWLAHPARHDTWLQAGKDAHEAAPAPVEAVTTPGEAPFYAFHEEREADEPGATLPETTASIPEGAMFDPATSGAAESALHADPIVKHGMPVSPGRAGDEAAAWRSRHARAHGSQEAGATVRSARADDDNEAVVKRASFRSCWERSPGADGKVSLAIVVDPARGVSARPVAAPGVPEDVVRCVTERARSLPLRVSPDSGPRSFAVSSSYVAPSM